MYQELLWWEVIVVEDVNVYVVLYSDNPVLLPDNLYYLQQVHFELFAASTNISDNNNPSSFSKTT